jgi:hypothetical protein
MFNLPDNVLFSIQAGGAIIAFLLVFPAIAFVQERRDKKNGSSTSMKKKQIAASSNERTATLL